MKILVNNQPNYDLIAVGVEFKTIKGESYQSEFMRRAYFSQKIRDGKIKQFIPNWYRDMQAIVRNQRLAN